MDAFYLLVGLVPCHPIRRLRPLSINRGFPTGVAPTLPISSDVTCNNCDKLPSLFRLTVVPLDHQPFARQGTTQHHLPAFCAAMVYTAVSTHNANHDTPVARITAATLPTRPPCQVCRRLPREALRRSPDWVVTLPSAAPRLRYEQPPFTAVRFEILATCLRQCRLARESVVVGIFPALANNDSLEDYY